MRHRSLCLAACPGCHAIPLEARDAEDDARNAGPRGVAALVMDARIEPVMKVVRKLKAARSHPLWQRPSCIRKPYEMGSLLVRA